MSANVTLCDDGIFRGIFGHASSERFLANLVNAVLRNAGETPVQRLEIKNPFQLKELNTQKEPILDIKALDSNKRWFDIEMQIVNHANFRERILYYWARTYEEVLKSGEDYCELRPVVSVVFTRFPIWPDRKDILFDTFQLCSKNDRNRIYTDHLKLHFITVPDSVDASGGPLRDDELKQWLKVLNYPSITSEAEMENIASANPQIEAAYERTKLFLSEPEVRQYIEARRKYELIQNTMIKTAHNEGVTEGHDQGLAEGIVKGRAEGQISDVRTLLEARFKHIDSAIKDALSGKTDIEELRRLLIAAATCSDINEFKARLNNGQ